VTQYIDWNYDTGIAIEYRRDGECNGCGQCCNAKIMYLRNRNDDLYSRPGDLSGHWGEAHNDDNRIFLKMIDVGSPRVAPCSALGVDKNWKSRCTIYDKRPIICKEFPLLPREIEAFDQCSFRFVEIRRWNFADEVRERYTKQ
jgi:Fe-S-cluster containining protein